MSYYNGPKSASEGLICCLDIGNPKSYIGSGTTCNDLSGRGYTGTVYNGPTYSSAYGGILSMDGSNDYIGIASTGNRLTWTPGGASGLNVMSIEMWVRSSDASGRFLSKPWNGNGEYNYWVNPTTWEVNTNSTTATLNISNMSTGNWEHGVFIVTSAQIAAYRNGVLNAGFTNHGLTSNTTPSGDAGTDLAFMTLYPYGSGAWSYTGHAIQGDAAILKIYNRVLSAPEILRNYNAVKSRFGL